MVIVIECFERNAAASAGEATDLAAGVGAFEGAEEDSAEVEGAASSLRRFFLSFFSFFDSEVLGSGSSCSSRFLFFFFFLSDSPGAGSSAFEGSAEGVRTTIKHQRTSYQRRRRP